METEMFDSEIIARKMMKSIQYDNGAVTRFTPEIYPQKWVTEIRIAVMRMVLLNSELEFESFTDEIIDDICCGEEGETQEKYGKLLGYDKLSVVLNDYFNEM
jgi:hypothetical protein